MTYEPRVRDKVVRFASYVKGSLGQPINAKCLVRIPQIWNVGFWKEFHSLTTSIEYPAFKGVHDDHMATLGTLGHVLWVLNLASPEMYIPGDVNIFVPVHLIQTDEGTTMMPNYLCQSDETRRQKANLSEE